MIILIIGSFVLMTSSRLSDDNVIPVVIGIVISFFSISFGLALSKSQNPEKVTWIKHDHGVGVRANCTVCRADNEYDARFCKRCGGRLFGDERVLKQG
jgi:hypothetical protein